MLVHTKSLNKFRQANQIKDYDEEIAETTERDFHFIYMTLVMEDGSTKDVEALVSEAGLPLWKNEEFDKLFISHIKDDKTGEMDECFYSIHPKKNRTTRVCNW